ncbi:MAG: lactate racemase domain-containing protein [Pirellula sp.]
MKPFTCYEPRIGSKTLTLHVPDDATEFRIAGVPTDRSIDELLAQSLDEPVEFPPLPLAMIEDDHIAIAIEEGVPEANAIACALVKYLVQHGTSQSRITIVLGANKASWRELLKHELEHLCFEAVKVVQHEPTDQESHGYVGASQSADAIYIQRDVFEAEVVLPIYCIRTPDSPSASDKYGISPSFANATTQHRWNLAWLEDNTHHMHLQEKLSHEAGWMMGVQFVIAVVPACDGSVAKILGGNPDHVFRRACEFVRPEGIEVREQHSLVVAFVEGDSSQQSWMNIARAAAHAEMQLDSNGSIVVCSDVKHLSQGMQQLGTDEPDDSLQRRLLRSDLEDAFAAAVISSIKSRRSIYLMSQLSVHQVENLGLAFIDNAHDIEKLCQSAQSVCIMRSAQF